jgi:hypothetical protein
MRTSGLRSVVALLALLSPAARGAAETGDVLCDAALSTPDTCVVPDGTIAVPDGAVLRFAAPNVRVAGSLAFQFTRCSVAMTPCASDADCTAPDECVRVRTGEAGFAVDGTFTLDTRAELVARGEAIAGDTIGPDGGRLTITAQDVNLAGMIRVTAESATGVVPAGRGGAITVTANGAVTIAPSGRLEASTSRGGCGGTITITGPATLDAAGLLDVDGATGGGTIRLSARDALGVSGTLQASNTNSDRQHRPACGDGKGGGEIWLEASRVTFTGSARARGREAAGGTLRVRGERAVTLDSTLGTVPINVSGGDAEASTPGGLVSVIATAGDVTVRQGPIAADGLGTGLGSDAGVFIITASGTSRCWGSGALCTDRTDCPPDDPCVETGGRVLVQAPLSAAGGDGLGSGCIACEIRGTGDVTVSGSVNVGGARQGGVGGKVTIAGGGDVTVGPGAITASAADGGSIFVVAGERVGAARDIGGALRLVNGTELLVDARGDDGVGGDVAVEACDVAFEPGVRLTADGGQHGRPGTIDVVAHERLGIAAAGLSASPEGRIALSYRVDATIAPDTVFVPAPSVAQDATLTPCPACGNAALEPLEECDGQGTCAVAGEVCIPAGSPGECACAETCGRVPGLQPGEDCDATDLAGETCATRGFSGGTLACTDACTFDESQCYTDVCGDGVVGPTESCDPLGPTFGDVTCESLGFPGGGGLACNADCTVDASGCVDHLCGNGAIEPPEACDGPSLGGKTCETLGFATGVLACDATCVLDTSGCSDHLCGNGVVEPTEACDPGGIGGAPPGFGGQSCESLGFPAGGSLACAADCAAVVTVPHCSSTRTRPCTADGDCPAGEGCVPGCRQCGNGFVDAPDEQCDEGPDNGSRPDHCRIDCRLPRCGDETVDRGEECDRGDALCRGGPNDGRRCCSAADCPEGQCAGEGCASNRDDLAGCCRCDCRLVPVACGSCDDRNPCTADVCDPLTGCNHVPLADGTPCGDGDACNGAESCRAGRCAPGTAPGCDDGDVCTIDGCDATSGCAHVPLGYAEASSAVQATLFIAPCVGAKVPARVGRLLGQARTLIDRADATGPAKAARLTARAERKLRHAIRTVRGAGHRALAPECAGPLAAIIADALARAGGLVP